MSRADERERLRAGASTLGAPLDEAQLDQLQQYLDLFERWNRTHNLTAVRERSAMVTHHLLDSLSALPLLRRHRPSGGQLLDVGSGGGLPGVVIAIAEPRWRVTSVDASAKKSAFVRQVAGALGLPNLSSQHARAETLTQPHDLIVCRAFASLPDFVRLTAGALAPDGVWLAMKGQLPTSEITAVPPTIEVFHVEPLTIPGLQAERCAVWMRPRPPA